MALQDILKKILDQAHDEVKDIALQTEEQKKTLQEQSAAQEKEARHVLASKTEAALESVEKKTLSMARRESARLRLEMKHDVLSRLMKEFVKRLETADEKTYSQVLEKLFAKMNATSGKILAPPTRIEITTKTAPQGFDVVANKDIDGGFIAEIGDITIDNSFQTLIFQEFSEPLMLYIADELKLAA